MRQLLALLIGVLLFGPAMADAPPIKPVAPGYHELTYGSPKASVTVIEYASLVCPHCVQFYMQDFQKLKKTYIDTGRVKYVYRDMPTEPLNIAMAAAALSHCAPEGQGLPFVDLIYSNYQQLQQAPEPTLRQAAQQVGIDKGAFDACIHDEALLQRIQQSAQAGIAQYNIQVTPAFYVNEQPVEATFDALSTAIDKALAKPARKK